MQVFRSGMHICDPAHPTEPHSFVNHHFSEVRWRRERQLNNAVSVCMCATTTSETAIDLEVVNVVSQTAVPTTRRLTLPSRASELDRRWDSHYRPRVQNLISIVGIVGEKSRLLQSFPSRSGDGVSESQAKLAWQVRDRRYRGHT